MTHPSVHELTAGPEDARQRLDMVLVRHLPALSRSKIQSLVKAGRVLLNGKSARSSEEIHEGDLLRIEEETPKPLAGAHAEDIPLSILHEDGELIVVNKPAGMVVHLGAGHEDGTLVNALLHHAGSLSTGSEEHRPGIVHRLDKETSGCIVVAKNDRVHSALASAFAERRVKKTYLAIVRGLPRHRRGTIDQPVGRHPVHRQRMTIRKPPSGRDAVTDYEVLASREGWSLVACMPRTGRTHQIRVHLTHLGHPIAGDPFYGRREHFARHLLHAWRLEFEHPSSGELLRFEAPIPADFDLVPPPPSKAA